MVGSANLRKVAVSWEKQKKIIEGGLGFTAGNWPSANFRVVAFVEETVIS